MRKSIDLTLSAIVKYTENKGIDINKASLKCNSELENIVAGSLIFGQLLSMVHGSITLEELLGSEQMRILPSELVIDMFTIDKHMSSGDVSNMPDELKIHSHLTLDNIEAIHKATREMREFIEESIGDEIMFGMITGKTCGHLLGKAIIDDNDAVVGEFIDALSSHDYKQTKVIVAIKSGHIAPEGVPSTVYMRSDFNTVADIFIESAVRTIDEADDKDNISKQKLVTYMMGYVLSTLAVRTSVQPNYEILKEMTVQAFDRFGKQDETPDNN